jgi:hypothetical protein
MGIIKKGHARQIGRTNKTCRIVYYRLGRCDDEIYIIIDGVVPGPGGSTTARWIPVRLLLPLFEQWARRDAEVFPNYGDRSIARFGKYFKPALPRNSTVSGRVAAVLRNERVLVAGDMVTVSLPEYPRNFRFQSSVRNPSFSLDDFLKMHLADSAPKTVVDVLPGEVFNPEDVK